MLSFFLFLARVQIKSNLAISTETMMMMTLMTMILLVRHEKKLRKNSLAV